MTAGRSGIRIALRLRLLDERNSIQNVLPSKGRHDELIRNLDDRLNPLLVRSQSAEVCSARLWKQLRASSSGATTAWAGCKERRGFCSSDAQRLVDRRPRWETAGGLHIPGCAFAPSAGKARG